MVITNAQAGGIEGNTTVDHIIVLKQTVKEITSKKLTAYVVFLDVQKAYDKAWLDAILYVLMKNGAEGKNLSIIKNSTATSRPESKPDSASPKKYQSKTALDKVEYSL